MFQIFPFYQPQNKNNKKNILAGEKFMQELPLI
jgi:hypothetical protein